MAETSACRAMTLNLALSYGSRNEIMRAVQAMTRRCLEGGIGVEDLNEELLASHLDTAGQPDPDLLIRTGGEHRLSNFLLWQISYAELYFTETKWPDFRKDQLLEAVAEYGRRQRRFGKTGAQVQEA
jgi:undecaprenyl diphosphate synthase